MERTPSEPPAAELVLDEDSLMWREVEDEVIVLDKRTWTYMGINGSGAVLWKEMAQGATAEQLVACLRATYGVGETEALRDVDAFVELLRGHRLLADGASG
jgi:hypothetical protein